MVIPALKIAIAYIVIRMIDPTILSWQCFNRPIVVGPIIGALLGDVKTGIILGASLESIFMGISAIGGSIPSDPTTATIITVAYTILLGENTEAGLALAIPIGTFMVTVQGFLMPLLATLVPHWEKLSGEGKINQLIAQSLGVNVLLFLFMAVVLFVAVAFGLEGLDTVLTALPAWVMTGLGAASSMMLAIGIAILTSMIWNKTAGVFFFLGYVLTKFLALSALPVAIIGIVIAVTLFVQDKDVIDVKKELSALFSKDGSQSSEEEGFFA